MTPRLAVDPQNELKELRPEYPRQAAPVRWAATLLSYVFHPVFVPVYIILFLYYAYPLLFAGFSPRRTTEFLIQTAMLYSFFPIVTILLLKALKFIDTIQLATKKDRIIPFIICGIYYFWMWYVLRNQPEIPRPLVILSLGIWIASSLGLMANIPIKISMHAISMGVMFTFILFVSLSNSNASGFYISIALLVAGMVCTARFIVSDHTQIEVYGGFMVGMLSQLIANWAG